MFRPTVAGYILCKSIRAFDKISIMNFTLQIQTRRFSILVVDHRINKRIIAIHIIYVEDLFYTAFCVRVKIESSLSCIHYLKTSLYLNLNIIKL